MKNRYYIYKNPISVVLFLIIAGGVIIYDKLQVSLFPEITFPKIKIIADAGLQPVNKMMVTVTKPIENAVKRVPDLEKLRSTTGRGSCEISAYFKWEANMDLSLQRIESRINEIRNVLPPDVQINVEKMNPSILQMMGYSLESNAKSPIELRQLAINTIKPFLSQVPGISQVMISGGKQKEYWLYLDKQKMATLSLSPDSVYQALSQTNFVRANGYMSDYNYLYLSVTDAQIHTTEDIGNTIIRNDGKRIVFIKDIAEVKIHEALDYVKINANGKDGLLIGIMKQPNTNLIEETDLMKQKVEELKKILPRDVVLKPYYVQADFVKDSVKSVEDSLWFGLILAIFVAILFLRSFKASLTILITIPVTICLTLIVIYLSGYTLNIMTLGAIAAAIGLTIDDAIVVVEQIHRTKEEHPEGASPSLVDKAIRYLLPAMIGSSLSTTVIFLPFGLMGGVAGAFFKVMTNTMIITLVSSFLVTWIGLPIVYLLFSKNNKVSINKTKVKVVKKRKWILWFIRFPAISILITVLLIGATYYVLPRLETGFLPEMDEGSIVFDYSSPAGTSLDETDRMLREVEKLIVKIPEVEAFSRRTGTQLGFFITEPNRGDYLIQLKKDRHRKTEEVISELRKKVESSQPGLRIDFGQVIGDMLGDLMTSVQPVEVKVFGDNKAKLQEISKQIAAVLSGVEGIADVFNGIVVAGPTVRVLPNFAKLAQFGISPANIQVQLQNSMQGNIVGTVLEKEQLTNIRVIYPEYNKISAEAIGALQVFLPSGKLTPIKTLADVVIDSGDAEIQRENLQSVGIVTARLEKKDLGSVMEEVKNAIGKKIVLPQGYHLSYGGAYAEQQQSFRELLMILIASCLLVFGVILFLFKDFAVSFLILIISLLGISGCYLAMFFTHTPLNVGSYTGLIMIVGIIGENAIFTFLQFKNALIDMNVEDAIAFSIATRLRPKLMTAIGAIVALMPLALGIGAGAQLHQPLAISVIGGFIVALPLLLIVLPAMLKVLFKIRGRGLQILIQ